MIFYLSYGKGGQFIRINTTRRFVLDPNRIFVFFICSQ